MHIHQETRSGDQPEPPHSIECEQQILGALLCRNDLYDQITGRIEAGHFYDPMHAGLFQMIASRIDAGQLASPITLRSAFDSVPGSAEVASARYLVRLAGAAVAASQISDYADMLADLAAKRQLLIDMTESAHQIHADQKGAAEIALDLETKVGAVGGRASVKPLIRSHTYALTEGVSRILRAYSGEQEPGISTGLPQLDDRLGFLRPGSLTILAGRPSMGKTSVAQNMVWAAVNAGVGTYYASLEMMPGDMSSRFISKGLRCRNTPMPYNKMMRGDFDETTARQICAEADVQKDLPLIYGERDVREISVLRASIRRARQELADTDTPLGLVVVDYVQMLEDKSAKSFYERVGRASDFCKSTAMELGLPVIALAQLSRDVERRDPPLPMLADMRESGKLEEDADAVIFCYRDAYYLQRKLDNVDSGDLDQRNDLELALSKCRDQIDLIVAKQRSGPTGTVRAFCDLANCHITADRAGSGEHLI